VKSRRSLEIIVHLVIATFFVSGFPMVSQWSGNYGRWLDEGSFYENSIGFNLNFKKTAVMVSFKPGHSFANFLLKDPRVLAYSSSMASGIGRAVMAVSSSEDRDLLALMAHQDIQACGAIELLNLNFKKIDLADASSPVIPTSTKPTSVAAMVSRVNSSEISSVVSTLEGLGTRHHEVESPNASATVESLWQDLLPSGASIRKQTHEGTPQQSVILTIPGTGTVAKTVILGAHLDSINHGNQNDAPGADDDASGIAAITEVLRVIKETSATFERTIELHAYAAEEVGLIGSQGMVSQALTDRKDVAAMLQLDMIGYKGDSVPQAVHIITTDTSPVLVRHLKDLAARYLDLPWRASELGAGTSDHRSWHLAGFHAAFAFEDPTDYNRLLHTADDKSDRLNFDHASQFTKLALAFLSHEAGLTSAAAESNATWKEQNATSDLVKMAVFPTNNGSYRLAAAVSSTLNPKEAELCRVSAGDEKGCQSLVTNAALAKSQFSKVFYASDADFSLTDGDLWRFNIYDANGGLVAMRTVKLSRL
jgi:hypothetical protein